MHSVPFALHSTVLNHRAVTIWQAVRKTKLGRQSGLDPLLSPPKDDYNLTISTSRCATRKLKTDFLLAPQ